MFVRVFVFVACVALPTALAFSTGAPSGACVTMEPQHGVDPQESPVPYSLLLSANSIRAGNEVELELKGKGKGDLIKGFLVQARVGNEAIGQFKVSPDNKLVQTISCGNGNQNAVTHQKMYGNGVESVKFTWVAPPKTTENVKFYATVALNGGVYWVKKVIEPVSVV